MTVHTLLTTHTHMHARTHTHTHTHTHLPPVDVAKVMAALDEAGILFRRLRDEPSKVDMPV